MFKKSRTNKGTRSRRARGIPAMTERRLLDPALPLKETVSDMVK
jgi:hypothetical protein